MEASARKRSALNYTIATQEELHRLLQKKRYQMVRSQGEQSDVQLKNQEVFLVPHKFPFIFSVFARDLGAEYRFARLADIFRKINTFRRVQVVRSSIPRKIIFTNLANHDGILVGLGKLKIAFHHPLSDRLVESTRIFEFALLQNKKLQCAIIDLDERDRDEENNQVTLKTNCMVLELSIAFAQYAKTQRFILFFKPFITIKANDLFYCLVKLNSSLTLKLYFLPDGPLTSSESLQMIPHQVRFNLSKIQIESGSPAKEESLLSKGSFISAVRRAHQQVAESNYRINVVQPDPNKRYLPFDSLSAKLIEKLNQGRQGEPVLDQQDCDAQRLTSIEGIPVTKHDLKGLNPVQLFSSKKLSQSTPKHVSASETVKIASNPRDQYKQSMSSHHSELSKKPDRTVSSQQGLHTPHERPLIASETSRCDPPDQISVESTQESRMFLAHRARNPGAQPGNLIASKNERNDEQGLGIQPALQVGTGFVRYEYRTEVVFSRGDHTINPDTSNKPSAGLHASEIPPQFPREPRQSPSTPERNDAPDYSRQRSDSSADAILTAAGQASAQLHPDLPPRTGSN